MTNFMKLSSIIYLAFALTLAAMLSIPSSVLIGVLHNMHLLPILETVLFCSSCDGVLLNKYLEEVLYEFTD